jgi:transcriptional regulator with XRE-family HTH domain
MTDFGAVLRAAREAAGISPAMMASRTHYSKPLLGLLETGKRTIKPEHIEAYSRALNVSIDTLQGSPDDPLRVAHEWLVNDRSAVKGACDASPAVRALLGERVAWASARSRPDTHHL